MPGAVNAVAGTWHQPGTTLPELLTQLPDQSESGDYRTLFVGDARVLPGSPTNLGYGIAFAVVNGRGASLDDLAEVASTRTGDAGTTGLGDGSRVAKDSPRIEAIGTVDELNSAIGVLLAEPLSGSVREFLLGVQHDLFEIGSELAVPGLQRH